MDRIELKNTFSSPFVNKIFPSLSATTTPTTPFFSIKEETVNLVCSFNKSFLFLTKRKG